MNLGNVLLSAVSDSAGGYEAKIAPRVVTRAEPVMVTQGLKSSVFALLPVSDLNIIL
jgi:hypothetical protein